MRAVLLLSLLLPAAASAATLRPLGTLSGPMVHVADLWDGAGAAGGRLLGPGPVPGGSIIVGSGQLGAIARAYGVDWQPQSPADQAVLSRPGAPLPLDKVVAALRPALTAQGAGTGAGAGGAPFDIALPFYDAPMLDASQPPVLHVEQTSLDVPSGHFVATLRVEVGEATPMRLRVSGTVEQALMAVVPSHRLLAGAVIAATDVSLQPVRASQIGAAVALDMGQAVGQQLRRMAVPGQPVPLADLAHPIMVARNDRVMIGLALPGLDLGAVGLALQPGAVGDIITVRNPVSGAVLSGEITGPDVVRVDAGVAPVRSGITLASR